MSLVTSLPPKLGHQFYTGVLLLLIPQATPHLWLPALQHHCFPSLIHLSLFSPLNTPSGPVACLPPPTTSPLASLFHGSPALYRAHDVWSHNSCQLTVLFLSVLPTFSPSWLPDRPAIWVALEFCGFYSPCCDLLNFDQSPLGNMTIVVSTMIVHTAFHMLLIHEPVSSHVWGMIIVWDQNQYRMQFKSVPWLVRLSPMPPSCSPSSCTHGLPHHCSFPTVGQIFLKSNMKILALVSSISPMAIALRRHSLTVWTRLFSTPGCIHGTSLLIT